MNQEGMDMALDEVWDGEEPDSTEVPGGEAEIEAGEVGADNTDSAPTAPETDPEPQTALQPPAAAEPDGVQAHMERIRADARKRDMARFMECFPGVKPQDIPQQVWAQVAKGVSMVGAYAMHENAQLKAQLAAERQHRANQLRTPGGLSSNSGAELDELDRMWNEDD